MHKIAQSLYHEWWCNSTLSVTWLFEKLSCFVCSPFFASWPLVLLEDQKQVLYGTTLNDNQEGNSSKCKIKIVKSNEEKECDRTIRGPEKSN